MLHYEIKSLFDAPLDSIIVQALNAKGVMGSGIALETRKRFPHSYRQYRQFCFEGPKLGKAFISPAPFLSPINNLPRETHLVCGVITSFDYGNRVDGNLDVLINSALALYDLCHRLCEMHSLHQFPTIDIYSNKFNSGLFGVKWELTEQVLNQVLKHFPRINWIVCVEERCANGTK